MNIELSSALADVFGPLADIAGGIVDLLGLL